MQLAENPLQIVSAAVTPVVMISATAILIGAVNSKHMSLSDRLRQLTAEFRRPETTDERRANIRAQLVFFRRRLQYTTTAHISLFIAVACFISMVMIIGFTVKIATLVAATLPSFLTGVTMLFTGVVCEIIELRLAGQTVKLECKGIEGIERR